jgi:hypothetical protein
MHQPENKARQLRKTEGLMFQERHNPQTKGLYGVRQKNLKVLNVISF